ncbi:hypothetical protein LCGC14_0405740 [marine sediment metagenome]|uniref:Uncharacterized protein n=1 Tax=marine sediment metagenome TaxID=412755 RepID=A0A0F9SV44_9ZZZZ
MEELNKKLALWAGISIDEFIMYPEDYNFTDPEFGIARCFKVLVPKLYNLIGFRLLSYQYIGFARNIDMLRHGWGIHFESGVNYHASERESTLALCLAIEKLIGEK